MKRGRLLLTACMALSLATLSPVIAQENQEQMAAYHFDRGEYPQAVQIYESLYKRTNNKYHYQRLLSSYLSAEQFKDALHLVERRQKAFPKDLYLYVDLGSIYLRQKQEKKARKAFEKAIESIGIDQQPVSELALAFINAQQDALAVRTYLAAREKSRNKMLYFNELIGLYQKMGDHEAMTNEYFYLLDFQPSMINSVQISMQKSLNEAPDERLAEGVKRALVKRVREHPDNKTYLEMMVWFAIQQKDFPFAMEQAKAVDARFRDVGEEMVFRVAQIAQNNEEYAVATDGYSHILSRGEESSRYMQCRVGLLQVAFAQINKNYTISEKELKNLKHQYLEAFAELGKREETIPLMRDYSKLMAYHAGDIQEGVSILDDILEIPRLKTTLRDEVKLELGDLLLFAGEVWDATLLYMQVEKANKNDLLGATAKLKNARLSYYNHDFEWAMSQLKVLRSSTSKLVANDAMELSLLISDNMEDDSTYSTLELFADADLLLYRNMLSEAWEGFDAISRNTLSHPLLDEVLMRKAQIRTKQGQYLEADSLLKMVADIYPDDITADDALFLRAVLNEEKLSNIPTALECYEKIMIDYPTSLYIDRARKKYNTLKTR